MCGNRFLITNAHGVPISLTYSVAGSGEEGTADVAAAPAEDPAVAEQMIETRTRGTVQIFLGGKSVIARANRRALQSRTVGPLLPGRGHSRERPVVPAVHLARRRSAHDPSPDRRGAGLGRSGTPQLWNPASGAFSPVPAPANLFCSGHALLPDGRVLIAGGHISDNHGLPDITPFSASHAAWTSSAPMARGRWYPTTTVMGNGDVV